MTRRDRAQHGFTLIEIMAVALIMMLMMALVIPNLGSTRDSALRDQARELASHLEFARQRAVMTGQPHRLLIDVEAGAYRLEWFVSENRASGIEDPTEQEAVPPAEGALVDPVSGLDLGSILGGAAPSFGPPTHEQRSYHGIPGLLGRDVWLDQDLYVEGVETPEGWLTKGEVAVVFERDGTTDAAEIVLANENDYQLTLEVRPLLEMVRIHDDEG